MSETERLAGFLRLLAYAAWSYVWLGAMFLLMTHELTPPLLFGLPAAVALHLAAWRLVRPGHRLRLKFVIILGFIALQVVCWRYFYFFRDPDRTVPDGPAIVSPADGFIVYVRPVHAGTVPLAIKKDVPIPLTEVLKIGGPFEEGLIVGIFMTPMSVHVNRSPVTGVIERRSYVAGSSMHSMLPMALRTMFSLRPYERGSEHLLTNERETLLIRGEVPVILTRIADPFVNKIVTWKMEGERLLQGERIGLIKMGSQADLVFPARSGDKSARVHVKEGQYVYAGATIIATYE